MYAPALVASDMATAVSVSPDKFSTIVAYRTRSSRQEPVV